VTPLEVTITRMAVATEKEAKSQDGDNRTMGRKNILPYGLYRAEGYISAYLAKQTGFSEDDLALLWQALANMFDHDHSAARGKMSARVLVAFKHDSIMGNAPAHTLLGRLKVARESNDKPARAYTDYKVTLDEANMPKGVTVEKKLWS
jgi:CRISPR-associated protein Csd2